MTPAELEDAVRAELAWRKKELLQLALQIKAAPSWALAMQIRSGITLLYAHWEGFVQGAGELLVDFVAKQGLRNDELAPGYLAIAFSKELRAIRDAEKSLMPEIQFAQSLVTNYGEPARLIPKGSVPTAANLSWSQFRMVAARLHLRTGPFELLRHLIDLSLVGERNTIAHGGPTSPKDLPTYLSLHAKVLGLLDSVAREVVSVAESRQFAR